MPQRTQRPKRPGRAERTRHAMPDGPDFLGHLTCLGVRTSPCHQTRPGRLGDWARQGHQAQLVCRTILVASSSE